MSCDTERFADDVLVTDAEVARLAFRVAGPGDVEGEWRVDESAGETEYAKCLVFWNGEINHIVPMDNVTFVKVVDE